MNRTAGLATILAAFLGVSTLAADAEAGKKKRRNKPVATQKVNARALGELMGPFKFGMTSKDVLRVLAKQIDERYAEKIKSTEDVYQQDKLRKDKSIEVDRVKKTYLEFKGTKSSWDVSIIDDQFGHNTDESMMMFWENEPGTGKNQRRFFFFHDGQLYKMFIALNSDMFKGEQRSFAYFKDIMEKRYGTGKLITEKDRKGEEHPVSLDWRSKDHHLRAIDKLEFHGSFCLVIADASTEKSLDEMRAANKQPDKGNQVINAVLEDDGKTPENPGLDENRATIDAILRED